MKAWDVTVTLDHPLPAEETLREIVHALPAGGSAGRSAWSDHLTVGMELHADTPERAADVGRALTEHALHLAGLDEKPRPPVVAVEVLDPDETERRSATAEQAVEYYSVSEAADVLGITPAAVRLRAQQGQHGAIKVGNAGWALRKDLVDREAASRQA